MLTVHELAALVSQMRREQRRYSRTRAALDLSVARDYEQRVDEAVRAILDLVSVVCQQPPGLCVSGSMPVPGQN